MQPGSRNSINLEKNVMNDFNQCNLQAVFIKYVFINIPTHGKSILDHVYSKMLCFKAEKREIKLERFAKLS